MRVEVTKGGGLVPVVITTAADTASLGPDDAAKLQSLVAAADLAKVQAGGSDGVGRAMPDAAGYEIVVKDGARTITAVVSDGSMPAEVQSLISFVASVPGHEEHVG